MSRKPPLHRGRLFTGVLHERRRDPLGFSIRCRDFGDVVAVKVLGFTVYTANSPEAMKHILVDNAQNYWKGKRAQVFKRVLGNGLLTAEGDQWLRSRRLAQPAFHRERLAGLLVAMNEATSEMIGRWKNKRGPFEIFEEMAVLTLTIVGRTLFTTDVLGDAAHVSRSLAFLMEETLSFNPFKRLLPTKSERRYREAAEELDAIIRRIIEQRRRLESRPPDLLTMLMEARDVVDQSGMDDRQLRDEALTFLLTGYETTASALTWLWTLLDQSPEVSSRLSREVADVLEGRTPRMEDLPRLGYLRATFDEALRLYPPAWLMVRQAHAADEVVGFALPKGALVVMSPYALHRAPEFWRDPMTFDPERFHSEQEVSERQKFVYLPFGAGKRMCIGSSFAVMVAQVIVAQVVQHFRVRVLPGQDLSCSPKVTLRPKGPIYVELERAS